MFAECRAGVTGCGIVQLHMQCGPAAMSLAARMTSSEPSSVRQARRLAISTARVDALEAQRLGLVHQVVADDKLAEAVEALLTQLRAAAPAAIAEIKALYARLATLGLGPEARESTAATIARLRGGEEAREGFAAFLDKRAARWAL